MYHPLVYHLDLCTLAYHFYHQSLVWPLDPYYEHMARKNSNRRTNFMQSVHAWCHNDSEGRKDYYGPGSTLKAPCNKSLDPILTQYTNFNPWVPSIVSPEGKYLLLQPPAQITNTIKAVYMSQQDPTNHKAQKLSTIKTRIGGEDSVYCFEGRTGVTVTDTSGTWSNMGYVLKRHHADKPDDYDVHIVFRGSRSGLAARAAVQGLIYGSGNGDWVTDTDFNSVENDVEISNWGASCRGFRLAIKTCIPTILAALIDIKKNNPNKNPNTIYITGHSLGGALAAHFTSAMVRSTSYGPCGSKLTNGLDQWPWKTLKLITFSAPVVGGKRFHSAFNACVDGIRVWASGDPITQSSRLYHVGREVQLEGGMLSTNFHEPALIRENLIILLRGMNEDISGVPLEKARGQQVSWQNFDSLDAVLATINPSSQLGSDIFPNFKQNFLLYLNLLSNIVDKKSTYKSGNIAFINSGADVRKKNIATMVQFVKNLRTHKLTSHVTDKTLRDRILKQKALELPQIQGDNTFNFLKLCVCLCIDFEPPNLPPRNSHTVRFWHNEADTFPTSPSHAIRFWQDEIN